VRGSRSLIDLDLSWNGFRSRSLLEFYEALAENRQLQYFNISWNNLLEKSDMSTMRGGPPEDFLSQTEEEMSELMLGAVTKV
jgi:hypothetical protein